MAVEFIVGDDRLGRLDLPLQEVTETWLLDRLPASLDDTAGRCLRACFDHGPFDGAPLERRRRDAALFESRFPGLRRWADAGIYVTSDQVLQLLFFNRALRAADAPSIALLVGLIAPDTDLETIQRAADDPEHRRTLLENAVLPDTDGGQIGQVRTCFEAVLRAARDDRTLVLVTSGAAEVFD